MSVVLKFRPKGSRTRLAPVFRLKSIHAETVPEVLLPYLDAVADMLVADYLRRERENKQVRQWLAQRRTGAA